MQALSQDFRYALRQFRRAPIFTLAAVLTLAVGIGANTAIFSLLYQALLRSLPVKAPQQLVELRFSGSAPGHTHSDGGDSPGARAYFSYPMYRDLRDRASAFNGLVAFAGAGVGFTWNNRSELLASELVTGNYFSVLGVRPALGRVLLPADETVKDGNSVAVLSYSYWTSHLGGDSSILNKVVVINGFPFTVVGVTAPGFSSARWGTTPAVFVPMTMKREITPNWDDLEDRRGQWLNIIGRLQPGESRSLAEASVNPIWYGIRSQEFKDFPSQTARARENFLNKTHLALFDGAKGFSPLRSDVRTPLLVIMGMVVLVLAMACVNTASLLLVRAAARVREFSMRYALGASRARVLRQLLLEGVLLGLMGAILGIALAPQVLQVLTAWIASASSSSETPFSTSLDFSVLTFTLAATLLVSILFSLAPAAQFWKPDLLETMRSHNPTGGRSLTFRRTCVVLQIGLSLLLLVGAGLFVRTLRNLRTVDTGIKTDHLLTFSLDPRYSGYDAEHSTAVRQRILDAMAALAGVRSVAATSDPELANNNDDGEIRIAGYSAKDGEEMEAEHPYITPGYFATLGIPLLVGRDFSGADTATSQNVALINESLARRYFGSARNAVGHSIGRKQPDATIVGVVKDSRHTSPRDAVTPTLYLPALQLPNGQGSRSGFAFYVRTEQPPDAAINLLRRAIHDTDSKLVVNNLRTMDSQIDETLTAERVIAMLASSFGVIATLLAAIGLYGVLAYVTAQRTREIGIRMAVGARPKAVAALILREVLILTVVALIFAIPASILLGSVLRSQLFNVSNTDPVTYIAGICVVTMVALLASALPVWRAATIDPMKALRID